MTKSDNPQLHPEPRIEDFMSLDAFAKDMGVDRKIVLRWRNKGMPHVRVDKKRILIHTPSLAQWLVSKIQVDLGSTDEA